MRCHLHIGVLNFGGSGSMTLLGKIVGYVSPTSGLTFEKELLEDTALLAFYNIKDQSLLKLFHQAAMGIWGFAVFVSCWVVSKLVRVYGVC